MSRRERGRFSAHTASETLQRQLTAPAHKWRKAWVAPSGLQPESSYKVCKWVRVNEKDMDDETNGNEGEDDDDEGEHEDDEDNDIEKEDAEDGEGEEKPTTTSTPAATETVPVTPAAPTEDATSAAAVEMKVNKDVTAPLEETATMAEVPAPPAETEQSATSVPSIEPDHTAAPANAIEMTNTAPGHTEDGTGDLGGESTIELTRPDHSPIQQTPVEAASVDVGSLGQNEDKMDIDEPVIEKGEAPEEDAGLVMGEMKPPAGQEELGVTDQDQAKETEAAASAETGAQPMDNTQQT